AHLAKRYFAFFKQAHEKRTADIKQVGCVLGADFLMVGDQTDSVPLGHFGQHVQKDLRGLTGYHHLVGLAVAAEPREFRPVCVLVFRGAAAGDVALVHLCRRRQINDYARRHPSPPPPASASCYGSYSARYSKYTKHPK